MRGPDFPPNSITSSFSPGIVSNTSIPELNSLPHCGPITFLPASVTALDDDNISTVTSTVATPKNGTGATVNCDVETNASCELENAEGGSTDTDTDTDTSE